MVLSPAADERAAEQGWFAGQIGLRLRESPAPGWRALVDGRATVRPVSSDSWAAQPGEIALAVAGAPVHGEVARARAAGLKVLWLATGRELATHGVVEKWVAAGLDALHLWLHAASAHAHDFHAGAVGGFAAIDAAIGQARAAGVAVAVSSSLTRSSAPVLSGMPAWLHAKGVAAWRVAAIESETRLLRGAGVGPHDGLVSRLSVALPHALQAMSSAARLGLAAYISGAPACLLGPFAAAVVPGPARAFVPACGICAARTGCCGVAADYLERFGGDELSPRQLRAGPPVAGPRWMFVGTGLLRHVQTDSSQKGPVRVRLPVLTGGRDDG
ncbi:MAG: hypothetical protein H0T76_26075 [Nannocystis sp.]|nr:hypothetical protein [Nannocystis sp.]MBA3549961.1 hypothetical protein [Nannocystis sp.]